MSIFEAAVRGYTTAQALTKEARGYAGAVQEYGMARASDPELFAALGQEERAQAQEGRAVENHSRATREVDTNYQQRGIQNLVQGLKYARDNGEDIGEAFDNMSETLPNLGVAAEDIPALRDKLIENPAILDQFEAALMDPKERDRQRAARVKAQGDPQATANALTKFDDVFQRLDLLESDEYAGAGSSVFGLPGSGVFTDGGLGAFGSIPGSDAANFVVQLEALSGDVRSQAFETLKGGGQITEKESEFAAQAIANLSRWGSYDEFQRELKRLRVYMMRIRRAAEQRAQGYKIPEQIMTDDEDDTNYPSPSTANAIWMGYVDEVTGKVFKGGNPGDPNNWSDPKRRIVMPRDNPKYRSKNKTKDGKNKSWIGKKADGTIGTVWAKGYGPDAKKKKATVSSKSKPKAKPKAKSGATKTSVRPPAGRPAAPKPKPTRRRKSTGGKKTTPAATAATKKTTAGSKGRNATRGKPTMAELASGSTLRPKARPTKPSRRRKSRGGRA